MRQSGSSNSVLIKQRDVVQLIDHRITESYVIALMNEERGPDDRYTDKTNSRKQSN